MVSSDWSECCGLCCMIKVRFSNVFFSECFFWNNVLLPVFCRFLKEMYKIKYIGKCSAISVFALFEITIFSMKAAHCCINKHMDIQIFSLQAAPEMDLLFVNIPYWLTTAISHTHPHTHKGSVFVRYTSCHSNREAMRCTEESGGWPRAPLVALEHLLSVWVKPIEIIRAMPDNTVFPRPVSC